MMITACGAVQHNATGIHPTAQTSTGLSSRQLCLTIFRNILGTKLPSSLSAQYTLMLKEAKEIQNLAVQTGSPEIARDLTNVAKASTTYTRAWYKNLGSIMHDTIVLQKADEAVINALDCTNVKPLR